jgi:hypothetical protein
VAKGAPRGKKVERGARDSALLVNGTTAGKKWFDHQVGDRGKSRRNRPLQFNEKASREEITARKGEVALLAEAEQLLQRDTQLYAKGEYLGLSSL